jgi:hypothetical protein
MSVQHIEEVEKLLKPKMEVGSQHEVRITSAMTEQPR